VSALQVAFTDRAGSPWLPPDGLRFAVDSLAKSAALPYKRATITATGPRDAVFELLEALRYGVKIYAADDPAVWLGYVDAVSVNDRGNLVGLALDDMANRVAVRYSYVEPGTDTVGTRADTAWADDLASQGEFGVKELWLSRDGMTAAAALQLRDTYLATHALPSPPPASYNGMGAAEVTATLQCRGWLSTLDWTYYANASTASTATSTQIAAILTACPFVTSVTVETASGISTSAYRKGDKTALDELLALLEMGTTNGRQYQLEIDEARNVRVVEAPADTEIAYRRRSDGQILSLADELVNGYRVAAGRWVELKDSIPQTVDTTWMRAVGKFLIDELEYLPGRGVLLDAAEASVKPEAAANGRVAAGDVGRTIIGRGAPYRSPHALTPKGAATAKPLSLPEIQEAIPAASPAMALAEYLALPELRGLWPMSSVNESGHVLDISGQGRTLTNNGGAQRGVTANGAPYIILNGTSQYLSRADEAGVDITGNLSLGAWIYLTSLPAVAGCVGGKINGAGNAYRLQVVNVSGVGYLDFIVTGASEAAIRSTVPVPVGQWVLVGGLFSPSGYVISRVNDVQAVNVTGIPASLNNVAAPFTVGAMGMPDYYLSGYLSLPFLCAAQVPTAQWNGLYQHSRALFGA
jgi:hypothetical protein